MEEQNRYENLYNSVEKIIQYLDESVKYLSIYADNFAEYMSIDEIGADSKQMKNCKDNLIAQRNYLKSTAIPLIIEEMNRIKSEMGA